jgi:hypothetical protein
LLPHFHHSTFLSLPTLLSYVSSNSLLWRFVYSDDHHSPAVPSYSRWEQQQYYFFMYDGSGTKIVFFLYESNIDNNIDLFLYGVDRKNVDLFLHDGDAHLLI